MISGAAGVGLERVEHGAALLLEGDEDEGRAGKAGLVGVRQGDIARDDAALLERAGSPEAGRRRQVDPLGKLGVGHPSVAHQRAQDRPVEIVEILDAHEYRSPVPVGAILCDARPRKSRKSATDCGRMAP